MARRRPQQLTIAELTQEAAFQKQIMQMADDAGWLCHHNFDSRRTSGRGLPDLIMARAPDLVFAELKMVGKYPDRDQRRWLEELEGVKELHVRVWTPKNWPEIEALLWTPRGEVRPP